MIILTTAIGYSYKEVAPFLESLTATGYKGKVAIVTDRPSEYRDVETIGYYGKGSPNQIRYKIYADYLKSHRDEPCIISDSRDVIFQTNPEDNMPTGEVGREVNVFCEDERMTVGTCPYNSRWMRMITEQSKYMKYPIICSGITSGFLYEYCARMAMELSQIFGPAGIDQGVHNYLIRSGQIRATIHDNEGQVYTLGYVLNPRKEQGLWVNGGGVPCMVHQYDRHQ